MTEYFKFDELTYPDVALLPRDCPIILPLGDGYNLNMLTCVLGNPPIVGMLPSVPYGWPGSGLPVPVEILQRLLMSLLNSLREDGFSRVFALTPQETGLYLGDQGIQQFHSSQIANTRFLPTDNERSKVILIPVGHTEQHGHHLPLNTDTLIIDAIAIGTAGSIQDLAYTLPVMPYGVSTHRQAFAGTLNCGGRAFEDFYLAVVDVLAGRGFNRIYFINGHGGNHSFLANIVKYAGERHRRVFTATAWLYLSGSEGVSILEKYRQSPIGGMGHACELETSLLLHLNPEHVFLERAIDEMDFISTSNYFMDWVEGGAIIANPPWDDDTRTGAYGAGSLATPEKGRIWLEAAILEKTAHVYEIHEQFKLREERRKAGFGLWGKKEH